MVTVNVAVLDSGDRPVLGFTAKDFIVIEDGVEAEVEIVLAPTDTPLDIAFVLDFSGSIGHSAPYAQEAEIAFLETLSPDDCVFVLPFSDRVGPGLWGRPRQAALSAFIRHLVPVGGTALFDAMLQGLSALRPDFPTERMTAPWAFRLAADGRSGVASAGAADGSTEVLAGPSAERTGAPCGTDGRSGSQVGRRQAMVVLTDGLDNSSFATHEKTLTAIRQAGVPVIAVGAGAAVTPMSFDASLQMHQLEAQWREFADISGGKFIKANGSRGRLEGAYGEVLDLLRATYLIGYRPPLNMKGKDTTRHPEELVWHNLKVKLRNHKLRVVTREGHYRGGVDREAAEAAVASASKLVDDGEPELALQAVDRALAADPFFWQAYYYRARALTLSKRWKEALPAAERAAELNPGNDRAHALAWLVAYTVADDETAWEHAIRAQQAGADMTVQFELLDRRRPAPADLKARVAAPKLFVSGSATTDLVLQATLKRVYRALRRTLSGAPGIALVDDPSRAAFFVTFRDEKVDGEAPRKLKAELSVFERSGKRIWKRGVKAGDIDDPATLEQALTPAVAELQEQLRKRLADGR
jgi:VWFA-related protein